ncbi:hypothetical protein B5X24_HaOG212881 [Helicoverpa armigera]|uniref:Uncharacterized protein n=1 Tax=Helicoverpa armigera TaxID=29058 RepID=A0A2W1BIV8_HELAM|nr:hypothetical protein B5X24_HaOG212881 [Helicoverpa armigera]
MKHQSPNGIGFDRRTQKTANQQSNSNGSKPSLETGDGKKNDLVTVTILEDMNGVCLTHQQPGGATLRKPRYADKGRPTKQTPFNVIEAVRSLTFSEQGSQT